MPTLPPERSPLSEREPHQAREMAESFGVDAERYDRTRPRYPDAMVDRIVAVLPGPGVLDVGCGTGIAARQFQAAGCRVLGVEPDPRMAEFARRTGVEIELSTFEAWNPADRGFDAVIAGQTWHWVDPVEGPAQAARVLRPGGRLAVFWNVGQPPPEATAAFAGVYRRVLPDLPVHNVEVSAVDGYSAFFTKASDGIQRAGAFGDPEQWRFDWDRPYTRDEWLDQLPTAAIHTRLPAAEREDLAASIGSALDALGGGFTMHYTTVVVTATRNAGPSTR